MSESKKRKLPIDVLVSIAEFTPLSHVAKFSERESKILLDRERKVFENSLPKLMKVVDGEKWYSDLMEHFWKAGKYLDLVPETLEFLIRMEWEISNSIPDFLFSTNYNNWFTTNRLDFLNFIKKLYYETSSTAVIDILFPRGESIEDFGKSILSLVKQGKILYDPIYLKLYLALEGEDLEEEIEDLKDFPIIVAPPHEENKEEVTSITEAYNYLLLQIFDHFNDETAFIFEQLMRYELPFYDLEIGDFDIVDVDYWAKKLKSYGKNSVEFKFIIENLRNYFNQFKKVKNDIFNERSQIADLLFRLI